MVSNLIKKISKNIKENKKWNPNEEIISFLKKLIREQNFGELLKTRDKFVKQKPEEEGDILGYFKPPKSPGIIGVNLREIFDLWTIINKCMLYIPKHFLGKISPGLNIILYYMELLEKQGKIDENNLYLILRSLCSFLYGYFPISLAIYHVLVHEILHYILYYNGITLKREENLCEYYAFIFSEFFAKSIINNVITILFFSSDPSFSDKSVFKKILAVGNPDALFLMLTLFPEIRDPKKGLVPINIIDKKKFYSMLDPAFIEVEKLNHMFDIISRELFTGKEEKEKEKKLNDIFYLFLDEVNLRDFLSNVALNILVTCGNILFYKERRVIEKYIENFFAKLSSIFNLSVLPLLCLRIAKKVLSVLSDPNRDIIISAFEKLATDVAKTWLSVWYYVLGRDVNPYYKPEIDDATVQALSQALGQNWSEILTTNVIEHLVGFSPLFSLKYNGLIFKIEF